MTNIPSFLRDVKIWLRNHDLYPPLDMRGMKVGDRVKILPELPGWGGLEGVIVDIDDDKHQWDELVLEVRFDDPVHTKGNVEFFSPAEVEKT